MRENRFTGMAACVPEKKKTQNKIIVIKIKGTRPDISLPRGGATDDTIPTKFYRVVDPRDVINPAKCEIKRFIIVNLLSGWSIPFKHYTDHRHLQWLSLDIIFCFVFFLATHNTTA